MRTRSSTTINARSSTTILQEQPATPLVLQLEKRPREDSSESGISLKFNKFAKYALDEDTSRTSNTIDAKFTPKTPCLVKGFSSLVPRVSSQSTTNVRFETSNVIWNETKVSNNRWLLEVSGVMTPTDDGDVVHDPSGEFLLIGDQIATKLDKQDYEVDMQACKFQCNGDPEKEQRVLSELSLFYQRKEKALTRLRRSIGKKLPAAKPNISVENFLERENTTLRNGSKSVNMFSPTKTNISTLKFFTEKGKTMQSYTRSEAKPKPITFGPSVGTQYHWFFVSKLNIQPSNARPGTYSFTISSNKFQYSFGRPSGSHNCMLKLGGAPYQCQRYPVKKSKFLDMVAQDVAHKRGDNQERLELAKSHNQEMKSQGVHYNTPKQFVDADGTVKRYIGMNVGASHHWFYRDAVMEETF